MTADLMMFLNSQFAALKTNQQQHKLMTNSSSSATTTTTTATTNKLISGIIGSKPPSSTNSSFRSKTKCRPQADQRQQQQQHRLGLEFARNHAVTKTVLSKLMVATKRVRNQVNGLAVVVASNCSGQRQQQQHQRHQTVASFKGRSASLRCSIGSGGGATRSSTMTDGRGLAARLSHEPSWLAGRRATGKTTTATTRSQTRAGLDYGGQRDLQVKAIIRRSLSFNRQRVGGPGQRPGLRLGRTNTTTMTSTACAPGGAGLGVGGSFRLPKSSTPTPVAATTTTTTKTSNRTPPPMGGRCPLAKSTSNNPLLVGQQQHHQRAASLRASGKPSAIGGSGPSATATTTTTKPNNRPHYQQLMAAKLLRRRQFAGRLMARPLEATSSRLQTLLFVLLNLLLVVSFAPVESASIAIVQPLIGPATGGSGGGPLVWLDNLYGQQQQQQQQQSPTYADDEPDGRQQPFEATNNDDEPALASYIEGLLVDRGPRPLPAGEAASARLEQPSGLVAGRQEPVEMLAIQRRRLERDRALEPPAWLRARPIRRDDNFGANNQRQQQQQQTAEDGEEELEEENSRLGELGDSLGSRSSRQLRQSNELYDEILRHLVEQTLEGRELLSGLYDELGARTTNGNPPMAPRPIQQVVPNTIGEPQPAKSQEQLMAGKHQASRASQGQRDQQTSQLTEQPAAAGGSPLMEDDDDPSLVVVGDEVSDNDDVTLIEPPLAHTSTGAGGAVATPIVAPGKQQHLHHQTSAAYTRQPTMSTASGPLQLQMGLGAGPSEQQHQHQLASVLEAGEGQPLSLNGNSDSNNEGNLLELLQSVGLPASSAPLSPNPAPTMEEQFHVIEDIDQVDNSQLQPQLQQAPSQGFGPGSDSGSSSGSSSGQDGDPIGAAQEQARLFGPGQWSSVDTQPGGVGEGLQGLIPMQMKRSNEDRGEVDADEDKPNVDDDDNDNDDDDVGPQLLVVPVRRLLPTSANVSPTSRQATAARQQPARPPTNQVDPDEASNGDGPRPSANQQRQLQMDLAIRLIRANYYSRQQLVQLATKLKYYLESTASLPRGAILGLFPMGQQQLLVDLDQTKLSPRDRLQLMQTFGSGYQRGSLVMSWPPGSHQNPVPILAAILENLQRQEAQEPDWVQGGPSAAAESSPTPQPLAYQYDESELDEGAVQLAKPTVSLATVALSPPPLASSYNEQRQQQQQAQLALRLYNEARQQQQQQQQQQEAAQLAPTGPLDPAGQQLFYPALYGPAQGQFAITQPLVGPQLQQQQQLGRPTAMQLASLLAYLSSLQSLQQQQQPLHPYVRLAGEPRQPGDRSEASATKDPGAQYVGHYTRLIVVLFALLASYVIMKLIMRHIDRRVLRRRLTRAGGSFRSLWSQEGSVAATESDKDLEQQQQQQQKSRPNVGASAATAGLIVTGGADKAKALEAGNLVGRRYSADSGLETMGADDDNLAADKRRQQQPQQQAGATRSLELLSARLMNYLNFNSSSSSSSCEQQQQQPSAVDTEEPEVERPTAGQVNTGADNKIQQEEESSLSAGGPTRFRTSRSYIRSLIEALTKARTQVFDPSGDSSGSSRCQRAADDDDDDDEMDDQDQDGDQEELPLVGSPEGRRAQRRHLELADEEAAGIVVSQMDISAAHLILDYMEKHLEDKERLRREWLELNAGLDCPPAATNEPAATSRGPNQRQQLASNQAKANQLVLQRLAKVGLSAENRDKNRNNCALPFDRNRVRLGAPCGAGGNLAAHAARPTNSNQSRAHQKRGGKPMAGGRRAGQASPSDYINASFIYDDDPRRPTHIIAQGPNEQTIGQFWQMIWEQNVSVIVMLTRLNENGTPMCHCYWPTTSNHTTTSSASSSSSPPPPPPDHQLAGHHQDQHHQQQLASPKSLAGVAGAGGIGPVGSVGAESGRRGSVTSVISSAALLASTNSRLQQQQQPLIAANSELSDNVLYFEVPAPLAAGGGETAAATTTVRFEVHLISEHVSSSDYLVRNMYLINKSTGETRTISQFHYLAWPEDRTPENVRSLLQFRRKVHKSYRNLSAPILVHCSDGTGRSGTYTLLDLILERIRNGAKEIDPRATLEHLRDQRIGLCANQSQFEFVLVALAEEIQIILNALPK